MSQPDRSERLFAIIANRYPWDRTHEKLDAPLARYLVRVSFEDASDVSDWFEAFEGFEDAVNEYRATRVWDLDSEGEWEIEWANVATEVTKVASDAS